MRGGSDGVRRTTEDARAVRGTGNAFGGTLDKGIALPPSPDDSLPGSRDPSLEPLTVLVEKGTRLSSASLILVTISISGPTRTLDLSTPFIPPCVASPLSSTTLNLSMTSIRTGGAART